MIKAIVYTSNTGSTARYAEMLGKKIDLPVFSLDQAGSHLPAETEIIYFGWLMAGSVKGYRTAMKKYRICAVCAVGMGYTGTQIADVQRRNDIVPETPLFTLQGSFDLQKLSGIYKLMMQVMVKILGRALAKKVERTPEEDDMLDMVLHGGDRVQAEHLEAVTAWYQETQTGEHD